MTIRYRKYLLSLVLVGLLCCETAQATEFLLTNGDGFAAGRTDAPGAGFFEFLLDSFGGLDATGSPVNHMGQEDFYFDNGQGDIITLNGLSIVSEVITPTSVTVVYDVFGLGEITVDIELTTPNMLSERIVLDPFVTFPDPLRLWGYTDFDVFPGVPGNNGAGDVATALAPNHIRQVDVVSGNWAEVIVHSSTPTHWEINEFPTLRDAILAGSDLVDADLGPVPGDNAFAFQWDIPLVAGEQIVIEKWMKYVVVPEPGTFLLLAVGAFTLMLRRRTKLHP